MNKLFNRSSKEHPKFGGEYSPGKFARILYIFVLRTEGPVKFVLNVIGFLVYCCSCLNYAKAKSWTISEVKLQGSNVKRESSPIMHGCHSRFA